MPALKESATDIKRRGDVLAFAAERLLDIAPTAPCSGCWSHPGGKCVLHQRLEAVVTAVADWKRK
jgi:hypothetical protein